MYTSVICLLQALYITDELSHYSTVYTVDKSLGAQLTQATDAYKLE